MNPNYLKIGLAALLLYFAADAFLNREITRPPGILIPEKPNQKNLPPTTPAILFKNEPLQPLAEYSIKARVLHKERYRQDWGAKYSPWDLALGWKEMSDSKILDHLNFSQMGRWYYISWKNQPLAAETMFQNSSNVHVIPADDYVASVVGKLRVGDLIQMKGYLVRVDARDGGEWRSSTSRTDKYSGACEVMYVQSIETL